MPTSANIDRIIRDFSPGRQQYAGAHLFFIDGPSVLYPLSPPLYDAPRQTTIAQAWEMNSSNDSRLRLQSRSFAACRISTSIFGVRLISRDIALS